MKTATTEVKVTLGSKEALVNGVKTKLDTPAESVGGRTFGQILSSVDGQNWKISSSGTSEELTSMLGGKYTDSFDRKIIEQPNG